MCGVCKYQIAVETISLSPWDVAFSNVVMDTELHKNVVRVWPINYILSAVGLLRLQWCKTS